MSHNRLGLGAPTFKYRSIGNLSRLGLVYLFAVNFLIAFTCMRLPVILEGGYWLLPIFKYLLWMQFVLASVILPFYSRRAFFLLFVAMGTILLHSIAHLYWPSLKFGIPLQDFYLTKEVTSNYSFDQAKMYVFHASVCLISGIAIGFFYRSIPKHNLQIFWAIILTAIAANAIVANQQWLYNFQFLTQGSGTALTERRAPGLLEDSGASSVVFAAIVAGLFYHLIFSPLKFRPTFSVGIATVAYLFAGFGTGGRIFYISTAGAIGVGSSLLLLNVILKRRKNFLRRLLIISATLVCILLLTFKLSSHRTWDFATTPQLNLLLSDFSLDNINRWLLSIDKVRSVHFRVMAKSFLEHPIFGTGLGSFHANFFEHIQWALSYGGYQFVDPPASMYLMLLSELGLAGVLLILGGAWFFGASLRTLFKPQRTQRTTFVNHFSLGMLVSIAFSFLIGIHLIFTSFVVLLGLLFIGLTDTFVARKPHWLGKRFTSVLSVIVLLLLTDVAYRWYTVPRAPSFRWKELGHPQHVRNMIVPIDVHGQDGSWLYSGSELIYDGNDLKFFIEMPPQYYPITVTVEVFDQFQQLAFIFTRKIETYTLPTPGDIFTAVFPSAVSVPCHKPIRPDFYCSFKIKTSPVWTYRTYKIGGFIVGK